MNLPRQASSVDRTLSFVAYRANGILAQDCPTLQKIACVAQAAACIPACATVVGCAACLASIGASGCLSCFT